MQPEKEITHNQIERLIEAIKHPIIQARPLEGLAQKAAETHAAIARSLRTVFLDAPDTPTHKY
jgi:hypothetical protein